MISFILYPFEWFPLKLFWFSYENQFSCTIQFSEFLWASYYGDVLNQNEKGKRVKEWQWYSGQHQEMNMKLKYEVCCQGKRQRSLAVSCSQKSKEDMKWWWLLFVCLVYFSIYPCFYFFFKFLLWLQMSSHVSCNTTLSIALKINIIYALSDFCPLTFVNLNDI